jgi:hypothetical protein
MRNINTLETGYESPNGDFDIWASGSYEHPFRFENQDTWLNPIITPSTILSTGMSRRLHRDFRIQGSILSIREQAFASSSKLPNVSVDLPSRFPLKQGIQLAGNWRVSDRSESTMTWIHDFLNRNHFASLDFQHTMPGPRLTLGVGMDLILAQNTQGWVGRYAGDDRVRGWLKYAF